MHKTNDNLMLIPWLGYYIYTEAMPFYDVKRIEELAGLVLLTRWELVRLYDTQEEFRAASRIYWTDIVSLLASEHVLVNVSAGEDLEFYIDKSRSRHWALFRQVSDET